MSAQGDPVQRQALVDQITDEERERAALQAIIDQAGAPDANSAANTARVTAAAADVQAVAADMQKAANDHAAAVAAVAKKSAAASAAVTVRGAKAP